MRKLKLDELGRSTVEEYHELPKIPVTVVLDNIRSGLNVGSIFRTADAYRIEEIILCGITARPPHKEILRTALGASDSVPWRYFDHVSDAITHVDHDHIIVAIEQTTESHSLNQFEVNNKTKYALIFGNEVNGISNNILDKIDYAVEIPQFGTKHSLNVAVCAGIVIWHFAGPFIDQL